MRFLFNCADTAGSVLFNFYRLATRRVLVQHSCIPLLSSRRTFASISRHPLIENVVHVPVGGSGSIKLSILRSAANNAATNSNAILYLPQGPVFSNEQTGYTNESVTIVPSTDKEPVAESPTPQGLLAEITGSTVITLNYRLGYMHTSPTKDGSPRLFHRYPTPVHDTLAGLDWILNTIDPEQLCVIGSNIGGSLALMLALTESRTIRAIAAYEPICDWTGLDEYCTVDPNDIADAVASDFKKKNAGMKSDQDIALELLQAQVAQIKQSSRRKKTAAPSDLIPLLRAREYLFQTPSKYFDAFASPMLFLRSAGKDVPKTFPKYLTGPEYPTPILKKPNVEDLVDQWDVYIQADENVSSVEESGDTIERPTRRRKALSRWPPYGLDYGTNGGGAKSDSDNIQRLEVTLPWVRLYARTDSDLEKLQSPTPSESDDAKADQDGNAPTPKRRTKHKDGSLTSHDSVLATQSKEMVSVMRRACFWGREKGYGEQKVTLVCLPKSVATKDSDITTAEAVERKLSDPQVAAINEAGAWFNNVLCGEYDSED